MDVSLIQKKKKLNVYYTWDVLILFNHSNIIFRIEKPHYIEVRSEVVTKYTVEIQNSVFGHSCYFIHINNARNVTILKLKSSVIHSRYSKNNSRIAVNIIGKLCWNYLIILHLLFWNNFECIYYQIIVVNSVNSIFLNLLSKKKKSLLKFIKFKLFT